jgi:Aldehyde dehydrogenase family
MTQASAVPDSALMIVGGEEMPAACGDWLETLDPATGVFLTRVPRGTSEDVDATVRTARAARPAWGARPAGERGRILLAIADRIAADAEKLTRLETLDVGKPLREARVDVGHAERLFRFYGEIADKLPTAKARRAKDLATDVPHVDRRATPREPDCGSVRRRHGLDVGSLDGPRATNAGERATEQVQRAGLSLLRHRRTVAPTLRNLRFHAIGAARAAFGGVLLRARWRLSRVAPPSRGRSLRPLGTRSLEALRSQVPRLP